jgi:hypothetical protein
VPENDAGLSVGIGWRAGVPSHNLAPMLPGGGECKPARWYRLAARNKQCLIQSRHHVCKGEGVPENDAEAARWYQLAAEQGIAWQFNRHHVCQR